MKDPGTGEADDLQYSMFADAVLEVIDVVGQVETAGFFAALDEDDTACVRDALVLECPDRSERTEHGIAVVGATPPV